MIFDLDPKLRWVFCMTHPDDEISICAWIKRLVDNGNEVFISWTHSTPEREREGRAAATLLGVPQDHLCFFGAADGDVVNHIEELVPQFSEWFDELRPDRVCCGAFEQGHIDHDSTNFIVNACFKGVVCEIPFYHTYLTRLQTINRFSDHRGEEVRQLSRDEQRFKKLIAKQYPSQNIWSVLVWYEVWQKSRGRIGQNLLGTERMRLQVHRNFLEPHVPPKFIHRVRAHPKWKRWEAAVRPLIELR